MSQESAERLRWLYTEWAKGNLWALSEIADPGIEWEWAEELASLYGGPGTYRGLEEIGAATLEWLAAWDAYWMTAEEFVEIGDQVLVTMRLHGRTADTQSVIEQRVTALWALRDGKAVRVRFYTDPLEAQAAAGIRQ
jgi:ketosteroid isomerase-like protein